MPTRTDAVNASTHWTAARLKGFLFTPNDRVPELVVNPSSSRVCNVSKAGHAHVTIRAGMVYYKLSLSQDKLDRSPLNTTLL